MTTQEIRENGLRAMGVEGHAHLPWKAVRHDRGIAIQTANDTHVTGIPHVSGLDRSEIVWADLIVRAVNNHTRLLEACKMLLIVAEQMHPASKRHVRAYLDEAEAAIAAAEDV